MIMILLLLADKDELGGEILSPRTPIALNRS